MKNKNVESKKFGRREKNGGKYPWIGSQKWTKERRRQNTQGYYHMSNGGCLSDEKCKVSPLFFVDPLLSPSLCDRRNENKSWMISLGNLSPYRFSSSGDSETVLLFFFLLTPDNGKCDDAWSLPFFLMVYENKWAWGNKVSLLAKFFSVKELKMEIGKFFFIVLDLLMTWGVRVLPTAIELQLLSSQKSRLVLLSHCVFTEGPLSWTFDFVSFLFFF